MTQRKINLNLVSAEELTQKVELSEDLLASILRTRSARNGFTSLTELAEMRGMTADTLAKIEEVFEVAPVEQDAETPYNPDTNSDVLPDTYHGKDEAPTWSLKLDIIPKPLLSEEDSDRLSAFFVRVEYRTAEGQTDAERHLASPHKRTQFEIQPFPTNRNVEISIEDGQGQQLVAPKTVALNFRDTHFHADYEFATEPLYSRLKRSPLEATAQFHRRGRYTVMGSPKQNFADYQLSIDLIDSPEKLTQLAQLFAYETTEDLPLSRLLALEGVHDERLEHLMAFELTSAKLSYDGAFEVQRALPKSKDLIGWIWFLNGPKLYAGFRRETQPSIPQHNLTILLPATPAKEEADNTAIPCKDSAEWSCCESSADHTTRPLNIDEEHLLKDADSFHDDPGAFCKPFANPARILGERSLKTVLRVEQPDIASTSNNRPVRGLPLPGSAMGPSLRTQNSQFLGVLNPLVTQQRLNVLPRSGLSSLTFFPLQPVLSGRRQPASPRNPIDWDGDPMRHQALSVAGGHILEWRVQWRSNGYSLGDVKRTLTLAPRQTRRIVKLEWTRTERARRSEVTQSSDELSHELTRDTDYNVAVSSSLDEWSQGSSESQTTGVAGGIGFAMGPVVMGGGASHGRASSDSSQQGTRNVAASEEQNLRDAIRQYGDSLRRIESTVITEVEQEETVQGVSEIIRNPNYCHSLTVLYYEILRHLRVDTRLGGVRECLFIPFSVQPFTYARMLQWRDTLRRYVQPANLRRALDHAEKVAAIWADPAVQNDNSLALTHDAWGDIPAGARLEHELSYVSLAFYIELAIERPLPDESKFKEEYEAAVQGANASEARRIRKDLRSDLAIRALGPFAHLLNSPLDELSSSLSRTDEAGISDYFRREIAPGMARHWVYNLSLKINDKNIETATFALATSYSHKRTLRVEVSIPTSEASRLTRADLNVVTLHCEALPKGSVARCLYATCDYRTEHFSRRIRAPSLTRPLIDPRHGTPNDKGAELPFAPDSFEQQHLRADILQASERLLNHLESNRHFFHKAIWWNMDRDELYTILDGYAVSSTDHRSLASVIERQPLGIMGNSLVFPVAAGAFLGVDGHKSLDDAMVYYSDGNQGSTPMRISLPTSGVYAQALMDDCNACEEHHGSTSWVLSDKEPELADLPAEMFQSRRQEPSDLTPTQFSQPIISLQNAPSMPQTQGLGGAMDAVRQGDAFRDMAGLQGTQQNAREAMQSASNLASGFGQMALQRQLAQLESDRQAGRDIAATTAAIESARDKGMISNEDAQQRTNDFIKKKTEPGGSDRPEKAAARAQQLLESDRAGSVSEVDDSGATVTEVAERPRDPDPVTPHYVIPLSDNKVLFLGFAVGSHALHNDHKKALEIIATQLMDESSLAKAEGHASTSGSAERNEELSKYRAQALFWELRGHAFPILEDHINEPETITYQGEFGNLRERYADNDMIQAVPGAGHRNDPVQRSVVLEFTHSVDPQETWKVFSLFAVDIQVSGHVVKIGDQMIVNRGGDFVLIDNSSQTVVNHITQNNVTHVQNINNQQINVTQHNNNQVHLTIHDPDHGELNCYLETDQDDRFIAPPSTRSRDWTLTFRRAKYSSQLSLDAMLSQIAELVVQQGEPDSNTPSGLGQKVGNIFTQGIDAIKNTLHQHLVKRVGGSPVAALLNQVSYGHMEMELVIRVGQSSRIEKVGTVSGMVMVVGKTPTENAVILQNAPYQTSSLREITQWDETTTYQHLMMLNNGVIGGISATVALMQSMTQEVTPLLPNAIEGTLGHAFNLMHSAVDRIPARSSVSFQAFDGDQQADWDAHVTGANLGIVVFTPQSIAFEKKR
ncbi:MAG: OmpA family protein [Alkalimonas sp.]|nr:OmpA family protein [Alkalimonas sp.]